MTTLILIDKSIINFNLDWKWFIGCKVTFFLFQMFCKGLELFHICPAVANSCMRRGTSYNSFMYYTETIYCYIHHLAFTLKIGWEFWIWIPKKLEYMYNYLLCGFKIIVRSFWSPPPPSSEDKNERESFIIFLLLFYLFYLLVFRCLIYNDFWQTKRMHGEWLVMQGDFILQCNLTENDKPIKIYDLM